MDDFRFIEEALTFYFEKMDSDCLNYLEENSITYQNCKKRMNEVLKNDKVNAFFSDSDEIAFNKEEIELLNEYFNLENRIYSLQYLYAYLRGYMDYKKIQTIFSTIEHSLNFK